MKRPVLLLIPVLFLLSLSESTGQTISQYIISPAGNFSENAQVSISWTIGETVTETYANSDLMLSQGFHQNFGITKSSSLSNTISMDVRIYPNPTEENLFIFFGNTINEDSFIELYDLKGQKYYTEKIEKGQYILDMGSYATGTYIIRIVTPKGYQTFKIVKH
jgi:hypothetical protein